MSLAHRFAFQSDLTIDEYSIPDFARAQQVAPANAGWITTGSATHTLPAGVRLPARMLTQQQAQQAVLFRRLTAPTPN